MIEAYIVGTVRTPGGNRYRGPHRLGLGDARVGGENERQRRRRREYRAGAVFLGVKTDAEVPELPELAEAGAQLSDFPVTTSVWQPGPDWTGTVGTPVDALAKALASRTETPDVYVCGPPAMVDAAAEAARDSGVSDDHIILEGHLPTGT